MIERHPNSERFHAILAGLGELHDKKQADYGSDSDPFANVRSSEAFGLSPALGVFVRMNDKMMRIQSFARRGSLANESVEDSLRDLAVYAVIAMCLLEEEAPANLDQPEHIVKDLAVRDCPICGVEGGQPHRGLPYPRKYVG